MYIHLSNSLVMVTASINKSTGCIVKLIKSISVIHAKCSCTCTTICIQPCSVNIFSRMFIYFFPDNYIDWTCPMKMFCLEHETMNVCQKNVAHFVHVWSVGLTNLTTFFRVLEAWCHCNFREVEALKVKKFGWTYRTGTQVAQAIVVTFLIFIWPGLYECLACATWHSYRSHIPLHNNQVSLLKTWLSTFSLWRCWNWGQLFLLQKCQNFD